MRGAQVIAAIPGEERREGAQTALYGVNAAVAKERGGAHGGCCPSNQNPACMLACRRRARCALPLIADPN